MVKAEALNDVLTNFNDLRAGYFLVELELPFDKVSEVIFYEAILEHDEAALSFFVLKINFIEDFPVFEHEVLADVFLECRSQIN
jgi:hypothetical protein